METKQPRHRQVYLPAQSLISSKLQREPLPNFNKDIPEWKYVPDRSQSFLAKVAGRLDTFVSGIQRLVHHRKQEKTQLGQEVSWITIATLDQRTYQYNPIPS